MALCRSASMYSKTKYKSLSFSALKTECSFIIFGWSSSCKNTI